MEVLIVKVLTFCQPFFNKDTKKLIAMFKFCLICSGCISMVPMAVPMHKTFFNWNLMVCFISLDFASTDSFSPTLKGNFPIFTKVLPNNFGICFMRDSEANRVSYGFAHRLINFFSLLNFFKPSTSIQSILAFLASSQ